MVADFNVLDTEPFTGHAARQKTPRSALAASKLVRKPVRIPPFCGTHRYTGCIKESCPYQHAQAVLVEDFNFYKLYQAFTEKVLGGRAEVRVCSLPSAH
jgi:hypothetical protein